MSTPLFRLVCVPAALDGVADDFVAAMLRDGELALLRDDSGLHGVDAVARRLGLATVLLVRAERDASAQERTVIEHAAALPVVWVAPSFGEPTREWARARGPMTLLVEASGPLSEDEQRRIERFVALLGRQTE
jgi:hypothetical protein